MEKFLRQLARLMLWAELEGATAVLPRWNGDLTDMVALPKRFQVRADPDFLGR